MRRATRLRTLVQTDMKLIGRDRFLLGTGAFILLVGVIVRLVIPPLTSTLEGRGLDLTRYYPLISSYLAVFTAPQLGGILFGFTLLEAREVGTLRAVFVSPLPSATYLLYQTGAPIAVGWLVIPGMALIMGVGVPPVGPLILISFVGAILGAIVALFVATFADNKVQAFALMKALGGTGPIVLVAWFIAEPWQYLAGVFPPYWVAKAYWVAEAGGSGWWIYLAVGAVTLLAALTYVGRRFSMVAHR